VAAAVLGNDVPGQLYQYHKHLMFFVRAVLSGIVIRHIIWPTPDRIPQLRPAKMHQNAVICLNNHISTAFCKNIVFVYFFQIVIIQKSMFCRRVYGV